MAENVKNDKVQSQPTDKEISTKEAYFAALNEWVKQANYSQNAMAMFPWYLMTSYPQLFQQQLQQQQQPMSPFTMNHNNNNNNNTLLFNNNLATNGNNNGNMNNNRRILLRYRILGDQAQTALIQQNGGYEYVIAPFWKRAAAEFIDMVILLILKILVTLIVVNTVDLDLGLDIDKDNLHKVFEEDAFSLFALSFEFFVFSTDLLLLEVLTKALVCLYEALLTAYCDGATLGKMALGIRIKHIEAMMPLARVIVRPVEIPAIPLLWQAQRVELRALLYPAETPSLQISLFRAFAKNMIMTLFFPMCFIFMFYKNNRTVYDVVTKTIVVEHNPQPTFRRP